MSHIGFCAPAWQAVKTQVAAFHSEPGALEPAWVWGFVVGAWHGATSVPGKHNLSRTELGLEHTTECTGALYSVK